MLELKMVDLTFLLFFLSILFYFYFPFILNLRLGVSVTSYMTITDSHMITCHNRTL